MLFGENKSCFILGLLQKRLLLAVFRKECQQHPGTDESIKVKLLRYDEGMLKSDSRATSPSPPTILGGPLLNTN
jgi:hypothetical protein